MLRLLREPEDWIHRRVESIALEDPVVVQRRISLDFTLDRRLPPLILDGSDQPVHFVPLAFLQKEPLVNFSVRDENDRALPVLTRRRNGVLALSILVFLAEALARASDSPVEVRDRQVPTDVQRSLGEIVFGRPTSEEGLRDLILRGGGGETSDGSIAWREFLAANEEFMRAANRLADNFILVVPLTGPAGVRRVLKYSFEEHGDQPVLRLPWFARWARGLWYRIWTKERPGVERRERHWWRWLRRAVGWDPMAIEVEAPAMAQGGSYHLEVEAPEGLSITLALLLGDDKKITAECAATRQRVHLYSRIEEKGLAQIALRPRPFTVLRTAWLLSLLTLALLVLTAQFTEELAKNLGSAVSILLLAPAGLAAYIARSREPSVTTEALLGLRMLAASAGLWSFAGAIFLLITTECYEIPTGTTGAGKLVCETAASRGTGLSVLVGLAAATLVLLSVYLTRVARPPEQATSEPLEQAEPTTA